MSARISRRALLAGLAALPALPALTALTLVGCEVDRTTAAPLSTVDTLDFSNRLHRHSRNPQLITTVSGSSTSAPAKDRQNSFPEYRLRPGATATVDTAPDFSDQRCG